MSVESAKTQEKLNELLIKLESAHSLQSSSGTSFFIFDYPSADELLVRKHIGQLVADLTPKKNVVEINVFELIVEMLREKKLLEPSIKFQNEKGDEFLFKALAAPLEASRVADFFIEKLDTKNTDMIFVTGVGSVFPLVRSHLLLNNIAPKLVQIPLVLFYPGNYDGKFLTLFNLLKSKDYYQASRLV